MSGNYAVRCPKCGAEPYQPCRALTTGRVTDTHVARLDAAIPSGLQARGGRVSEYELIENGGVYEIGRQDGRLIAACECGSGESVLDKGLGRALIAAWKSRHRACNEGGS